MQQTIERRVLKHLSRAKSTVKHIEIDMTAPLLHWNPFQFLDSIHSPAFRKAMKWNGMWM